MTALRVRQVVAAVHDLDAAREGAAEVGLPHVYDDPDVGAFGATNSLHRAGDTFLELLAEREPGTDTALGRYLARRGPGGYMVIVQVDDLDGHLAEVRDLEVRVVWEAERDGIRGAHLHPADVGGAILSLDQVEPPEAWPWCGPDWTGGAPEVDGAPIESVTIRAREPHASARHWGRLLGAAAEGTVVHLAENRIEFATLDDGDGEDRLVAVHVPGIGDHQIGGLHVHG